jgi:hypothetical protein
MVFVSRISAIEFRGTLFTMEAISPTELLDSAIAEMIGVIPMTPRKLLLLNDRFIL